MSTTVIAFGRLTDIVGKGQLTIPHATDTNQVLAQLQEQFPALASAPFIMAVDKQIVHGNTALSGNNTVALLPPFAGG
jgi:Molybdopterin converting factor, small subunit